MSLRTMRGAMLGLLIDVLLAAVTLWVAWRVLSHDDLFVSVVLFIAFGLLMSLLWVRLGAEDIALAEATIGAGITGALLLDAIWGLHEKGGYGEEVKGRARAAEQSDAEPRWLVVGSALLTATLGASLAIVIFRLPRIPGGLTTLVADQLERSGVQQPVTAVLVNFRGYDTLLEIGVLFLTGVGMLAVRRSRDLSGVPQASTGDPLLIWLIRLLTPVLVLSAFHLLLLGTRGAGGGFQSGAVLAAAGILLFLGDNRSVAALQGVWLRAALSCGLAVFLAIAVGLMLFGGRLLEFSPGSSRGVIVVAEAAMAVATGFTLAALFAGARPFASAGNGRADTRLGE